MLGRPRQLPDSSAVGDAGVELGRGPEGPGPSSVAPALADLPLRRYRPVPRLVVPRSDVVSPAVPVIDAHNHLGRWLSADWMTPDVDALLRLMDDCHVERVVNLDGCWGEQLSADIARYDGAHPGRFTTFCHVQWARLADADDPVAALLDQLEDSARRGARGVKVWKDLGLHIRDASGALVLPGDPRVVEVLGRAGELGLPVVIHTADPVAFFDPLDERNERLDELAEVPQWWFGDPSRYPSFQTLMASLDALLGGVPGTTVIGAHVGCHAEDLGVVSAMLDRHPNFHVDLGGRLAEIGRQPRAFARFVAAHPDRVLFGTDAFPLDAEALRTAYRFLETDDEHFAYAPWADIPTQGRWAISGAALPPAHLEAIYRGNALRLGL